MPEFLEEIREEAARAGRQARGVLQRAHAMADDRQIKRHTHVIKGHPVRDIVKLAADLEVDLLVIGSSGRSALYARIIGSRAARIPQLAHCPVLVVK